jgi:hypothetical protein
MYKHPIIDFLGKLCSTAAGFSEVLSWDLSSSNQSSLCNELGHNGVTIVKWTSAQNGVIYVIDHGHTLSNTENIGWRLAVGSSSSALLCAQSLSSSHINDISRCLIRRGIQFWTLAPHSVLEHQAHSPWVLPAQSSINFIIQNHGHKFDATDYVAYEAARDSFFM